MKDNDHIQRLVDETFGSLNNIKRANPKANLLTRINSRLLQSAPVTVLDKVTTFITRPWVAMCGLIFILLLNVVIISSDRVATGNANIDAIADESYSVANTALYDVENIEP